jgi:general secretion pathway protein K
MSARARPTGGGRRTERSGPLSASENPRRQGEEGFALIVVLIVLMIVAIVATDLAHRARVQSYLAMNAKNDYAVELAALGWIEVVKGRLLYDLKKNQTDSEDDVWAAPELQSAQVGDVQLEVLITDEAAKLDLRRLVASDKTIRDQARKQFVRLLTSFRLDSSREIDEGEAEQLLEEFVKYVEREKDGTFPVAAVEKDAPPILTVDELKLVEGFHDPEDPNRRILYDEFPPADGGGAPGVGAGRSHPRPLAVRHAPLRGRININTAPVEVLRSLFSDERLWDLADAIVEYRSGATESFGAEDEEDLEVEVFERVEDLTKVDGITDEILAENRINAGTVTVASNTFSITVFATREELTRQFRIVVRRSPRGFKTLLFEERKDPRYVPPEEETAE